MPTFCGPDTGFTLVILGLGCRRAVKIKGLKKSGKNVTLNLITHTNSLYFKLGDHQFNFTDFYNVLSTVPKWKDYSSSFTLCFQNKCSVSSPFSNGQSSRYKAESDNDSQITNKPIGQKKAKFWRPVAKASADSATHQKSLEESTAVVAQDTVAQRKGLQSLSNNTMFECCSRDLEL